MLTFASLRALFVIIAIVSVAAFFATRSAKAPVPSEAPILLASPNPVPAGLAPATTTLSWTTGDGSIGRVMVSVDGLGPKLLATGTDGTSQVDWIATGSTYEFQLYRDQSSTELLATVVVTRRDDAFRATVLAVLALFVGGVALANRRAWLLDVGPVAIAAAGLWVKFVLMTIQVRPGPDVAPAERAVLAITLAVVVLLVSPVLLAPRRMRLYILLAISGVATLVGYVDILHFRALGDVASLSELANASQLALVIPTIASLLETRDVLYFIDILAGLAALRWYGRTSRRAPAASGRQRLAIVSALVVGAVILAAVSRDAFPTVAWPRSRLRVATHIGVLPFHVYDAVQAWSYPSTVLRVVDPADRDRVRQFLADRPSVLSPMFGRAKGRNLIMINAESLNAFPIGLRVGGQEVTPHLTAFATQSLSFTNFYDQTYLGRTSDAEFMALQSLHPLPVGAVATLHYTNDFFALPSILGSLGYDTFSTTGGPAGGWNMDRLHPRYGFASSYFAKDFAFTERFAGWAPDVEFFDQTFDRIQQTPEPFVSFLLTSSTHSPFQLPNRLHKLRFGSLDGTRLGNYLQTVHYFDAAFGAFIAELNRSGILDRSVVALYGDHYASSDGFSQLAGLIGDHPWNDLSRRVVNRTVPFMIRLPHGAQAGVQTTAGGHMDIAPTLLSLLGVEGPSSVMLGQDLTAGQDALVVFRDGSFVDGRHWYFESVRRGAEPECYEVETGRPAACAGLRSRRLEATERLAVSDLIVQGNLISDLLADMNEPGPRRP